MTHITTRGHRRGVPHAELISHRVLAASTALLGIGLAANSLLGPLITGTIRYRFSATLINQGIGLDAVAIAAVFPVAVSAAVLIWRRNHAGLVLAFIPATFAAYMLPQYVVGPEYLRIAGNNERFFPFHVALLVLTLGVLLAAWQAIEDEWLLPHSRRSDRMRAMALFGVAGFILFGRWLPALIDLVGGGRMNSEYLENPTSYLLIGLLDIGVVVPAAVTAGMALLRGVRWARKAAFAVIAWFALVPASIAAMAITMEANADPNAEPTVMWVFTVAAVIFTVGAALLFRPLFVRRR